MNFKHFIKSSLPKKVLDIYRAYIGAKPLYPRICPICGYQGFFSNSGRPLRLDASCPKCGSLERHRLFWLWLNDGVKKLNEPILHFAPEKMLEKKIREIYSNYKTADLFNRANCELNIESIDLSSSSIETVICNHVLEHVNDRKALKEIHRILSPNGRLITSVPIIEGWNKTYENFSIQDPSLRELHFGQYDHIRYYGKDFRDRLNEAGFLNSEEFTAEGENVIKYGLLRGEKLFICHKA